MKILLLGQHPAANAFTAPLEEAGIVITRWDGSLPPPTSADYSWLVIASPSPYHFYRRVRQLRTLGVTAPLLHLDLEIEGSLNLLCPAVAGANERYRHEQKIFSCSFSPPTAPTAPVTTPFGEIIFEYHAPCGAEPAPATLRNRRGRKGALGESRPCRRHRHRHP